MNISSIQTMQLQIWQNTLGQTEKPEKADTRLGTTSVQVSNQNTPPVLIQGIVTNINYLEEQIKTLLYSYPPLFPAGSPQRLDLIKKIKGLEQQIGNSSSDVQIKKTFTENLLPAQATDKEISDALDKLTAFRDKLQEQGQVSDGPVEPGTIISRKV